jgi:hypothetical protein
MQPTHQVNISSARYIELLELENQSLKSMIATQQVKRTTMGCARHDLTRQLHAVGLTLKQWAQDRGFKYQSVKNFVCGWQNTPAIREALVNEGFLPAEN